MNHILHRLPLIPPPGTSLQVFGIVRAARKMKECIFFDVQHPTGQIQLCLDKSKCGKDADWAQAVAVKVGDRIRCSGVMGVNNRGIPTIFIDIIIETSKSFLDPKIVGEEDHKRIASSMVLARLCRAVTKSLVSSEFLRIDTRLLTSFVHDSISVRPIEVIHPGFGAKAFLSPSPAQSLLEAIAVTGEMRVFALSRTFILDHRHEDEGVEAVTVMGRTLKVAEEDLIALTLNALLAAFEEIGLNSPNQDWSSRIASLDSSPGDENEILISREDGLILVRISFNKIICADCSLETINEAPFLGSFSIHPERLLKLGGLKPIRTLTSSPTRANAKF